MKLLAASFLILCLFAQEAFPAYDFSCSFRKLNLKTHQELETFSKGRLAADLAELPGEGHSANPILDLGAHEGMKATVSSYLLDSPSRDHFGVWGKHKLLLAMGSNRVGQDLVLSLDASYVTTPYLRLRDNGFVYEIRCQGT